MLAVFMIVVSCGTPCVALAAGIEKGQVEISGSGGSYGGIGMLNGAVGTAATDRAFVMGEFSYIPGKDFYSVSFKGYGFAGGVQYMFPLSSEKLVPYAAGGLSYLRFVASASGLDQDIGLGGTGIYFGGGLRYYVSDRWGFRPELTFHTGSWAGVRLQMGLFYQFGK